MLLGARQFFSLSRSALPSIDGIMMIGWSLDTGLAGADATSSFGTEVDVIFPNMQYNSAENDFLGNYNGNAANTILIGLNSSKPYTFCFGSNRAPSVSVQWGATVEYSVTADYSGSVLIDVNGSQSSATASISGFASSSEPFLIGNGGRSNGGYRPAPVVIKQAKFTLDGVVAANYVPTISGGKIGWQDTIRETFASAPVGGVTLAYMEALT